MGVPVESGVQYYYDGGWFGMFAPARTPTDVVETLAREVRTAMQKPQIRKFVADELRAYGEMVCLAGVKPE